jgi:flavin-dependent dehydrogenase
MKEPFKDNVLFVGDATWVMEATNAAAILFGWKAANAVTLAILDGKINKEGISSYLDWWEKTCYEPYGRTEFKPIHPSDFLTSDDMDYLVSLIKEPLLPTMDFFKLFGTIGNAFGELFPVIQEERPDIMDKIMGVANRMEELEKKARTAGFPNR